MTNLKYYIWFQLQHTNTNINYVKNVNQEKVTEKIVNATNIEKPWIYRNESGQFIKYWKLLCMILPFFYFFCYELLSEPIQYNVISDDISHLSMSFICKEVLITPQLHNQRKKFSFFEITVDHRAHTKTLEFQAAAATIVNWTISLHKYIVYRMKMT